MHLDQSFDERESDAKAAGGPLNAPIDLGEHVENSR